MDPDKLTNSLTELVKKFVISFCQVNVGYNDRLDVFGSIHVRSDDCDVVAFVLNEHCYKHNNGDDSKKNDTSFSNKTIKSEVTNNVGEETNSLPIKSGNPNIFLSTNNINNIKQETNHASDYADDNNEEVEDIKYPINNNAVNDIIDINDDEDDNDGDDEEVTADYNDDGSTNYIDNFMESDAPNYSTDNNSSSNNNCSRFNRSFPNKNFKLSKDVRPSFANNSRPKKFKTETDNNYNSFPQQHDTNFNPSNNFPEGQNDIGNSEFGFAYQQATNVNVTKKPKRRNSVNSSLYGGMNNGDGGMGGGGSSYFQVESTYSCTVCGCRFKSMDGLKCHVNSKHSLQKLYKCHFCPQSFLTRQASYSHRIKFHNITNGGGTTKSKSKLNSNNNTGGGGYNNNGEGGYDDGYGDDGGGGGGDGYS